MPDARRRAPAEKCGGAARPAGVTGLGRGYGRITRDRNMRREERGACVGSTGIHLHNLKQTYNGLLGPGRLGSTAGK